MLNKTRITIIIVVGLISGIITACAQQATPVVIERVIEKTVVVTQLVEKEIEKKVVVTKLVTKEIVLTPTPTITPTPLPTPECEPTNQIDFVYSPKRLEVHSLCIHVEGTVQNVGVNNDDGDAIINLALDKQYQQFLTPENNTPQYDINGALHMEIVCYVTPILSTVADLCAEDSNPLQTPLPQVGQRIWAEGRWVLDLVHLGYAELHPVYRWGVVQ